VPLAKDIPDVKGNSRGDCGCPTALALFMSEVHRPAASLAGVLAIATQATFNSSLRAQTEVLGDIVLVRLD
jgi:hypothetical protein